MFNYEFYFFPLKYELFYLWKFFVEHYKLIWPELVIPLLFWTKLSVQHERAAYLIIPRTIICIKFLILCALDQWLIDNPIPESIKQSQFFLNPPFNARHAPIETMCNQYPFHVYWRSINMYQACWGGYYNRPGYMFYLGLWDLGVCLYILICDSK